MNDLDKYLDLNYSWILIYTHSLKGDQEDSLVK